VILDIPAYVRDGTMPDDVGIDPGIPTVFPITWPKWGDGRLRLTVKSGDLFAYDLTGCAIIMGVRRNPSDAEPAISREATILDAAAGRADVELVLADTAELVEEHDYQYDIQLIDADGLRWLIVPPSLFRLRATFAQPDDAVTVPEEQEPLALGPGWLQMDAAGVELLTDGTTTEQLVRQVVFNFDDVTASLDNIFARLTAMARVSGGSGTVRVRYGGTSGLADGTLIFSSAGITGLTDTLVAVSATTAKPIGAQPLKITLQNTTVAQRTYLNSFALRVRGAA
jgi:hypothetical protein